MQGEIDNSSCTNQLCLDDRFLERLMTESEAMQRALDLAKRGTGYVSPNPRVGAVILDKDGNFISEGWHKKFGAHHAEIDAINNANRTDFSDCTLVVNLEPCFHYGKTPPCVDEIIKHNFKRVVIGMIDPNPMVSGKSIEKLKASSIEVKVGILEEEAKEINKGFAKWIKTKEPYIILKIAQSIDGNIALKNGVSQWITSPESRSKVQYLRSEVDAILIGKNTAIMDNPHLTVRENDLPTPKRIVLDSHLSLPLDLNLFTDEYRNKSYIVCDENAITSVKAGLLIEQNVQLIPVRLNYRNKIDLVHLIRKLGSELSITSIMVEGGAQLFSNFVHNKLVDEFQIFVAPKILGNGLQAFSDLHIEKMENTTKMHIKSIERIGEDIYIKANC